MCSLFYRNFHLLLQRIKSILWYLGGIFYRYILALFNVWCHLILMILCLSLVQMFYWRNWGLEINYNYWIGFRLCLEVQWYGFCEGVCARVWFIYVYNCSVISVNYSLDRSKLFLFFSSLSLKIKWASCIKQKEWFCFLTCSTVLCLLIVELKSLVVKVVSERCLLIAAILLFCWYLCLILFHGIIIIASFFSFSNLWPMLITLFSPKYCF